MNIAEGNVMCREQEMKRREASSVPVRFQAAVPVASPVHSLPALAVTGETSNLKYAVPCVKDTAQSFQFRLV